MISMMILVGLLSFNIESNTLHAEDTELQRHFQTYTSYFDTSLSIQIYLEEGVNPDPIWDIVDSEFKKLHELATRFESFDGLTNVKTINDNPDVAHEVDSALLDITLLSLDYYNKTNGLFNVSLGPVIDVWDSYRTDCLENGNCAVPSQSELENANQYVNIDNIVVNEEDSTIMVTDGTLLDLGGIAKGYAAKVVGDLLKDHHAVEKFLLNAGTSNIEVFGDHPNPERVNGEWRVGLSDPNSTNPIVSETFASIQIFSGDNVMTSGDYQRFYTVDEVEYHHLIDPFTLWPANTMRAVTVVGPDGAIGDIYATAMFMMDVEDALNFINAIDDYEALIYGIDNLAYMSENFEDKHLVELTIDIGDLEQDDPSTPGEEPVENDDNANRAVIIIAVGFIVIMGSIGAVSYFLKVRKR